MALTKVQTIGIETGISLAGVTTVVTLNASGNVTAVDGTFTGNVSVAGTLTYEDVTNVDSVGLITARNGVSVTGGDFKVGSATTISQDNIFTTGIVTATSFYGDGSNLTGIDATQIVTGDTSVQTTDTGSDGTIKFNTDGSERARIDSSGRFGIGTNNPQRELHVQGSTNGTIRVQAANSATSQLLFSDSDAEIRGRVGYYHPDDALDFYSAGQERARFDSTGKFGIGTASPSEKLTVDGGICARNTSDDSQIKLSHNGTIASISATYGSTGAYDPIAFFTSDSERARITSEGRLLVGSTTSLTNFKYGGSGDFPTLVQFSGQSGNRYVGAAFVNTHSSDAQPILRLAKSRGSQGSESIVNNGDYTGSIQFMGYDGTRFIDTARIDSVVNAPPGTNDMPGRLSFLVQSDGASVVTERMRIDSGGGLNCYHDAYGAQFRTNATAGTTYELIYGSYGATNVGNGTMCFRVFTNGNVQNTNNSYGAISDIKLKENIVDASSQWDDIKAIQVRNYNFKEETGQQTHTQLGVVAQEVELVSPGLVTESPDRQEVQVPVLDSDGNAVLDENGDQVFTTETRDLGTTTKSVNYSVLYMKAVKALQEAMTRIETLETANASLEARLTALEGQ